jgi:hypothetical protein
MSFAKGSLVERFIDGFSFKAVIESYDTRSNTVKIKYCDDDVIEEKVPIDEISAVAPGSPSRANNSQNVANNNLLKPLAGLIDDDSEVRKKHIPKITVHGTNDLDSSEAMIIINGADNRLAVGTGIRALRYLKHN